MKKQLLIGALGLSTLFAQSQVIPNIDWVQYFSEKSQIGNFPSAIDASNNAYTTGYTYPNTPSNQDATTIKYNTSGVLQWTANYDNGGVDNGKAIVIDAAGNSYVTGESDGTGTGRDIFTIKYDANGTILWVKRFNGATNGNDVGNAIVLDNSGNVYVTGYTTNMGGNRDYVTIKYDAAGTQQFAVTYAGAGNGNDEAVAIAINSNRLYVTGNSISASGNQDIVTIRLNTNNGNTVWTKSINGTSNGLDVASALLAYNNDVVVVGQINNSISGNDYITTYYNGSNGNISWQKTYDFANTSGGATALTADASGRFAITGVVNNAGLIEYHTLLYSNTGSFLWVNKANTNLNYISANPQIAVDGIANHFYVCGQKQGTGSDIYVYQITPSGNRTWEETFNGAQNSTDAAVDLVVNSAGEIFIEGASLNSNAKFDYTTIKISQTPVAFPIDGLNETPSQVFAFTENKGQLLTSSGASVPNSDVQYYTEATSPNFFIQKNKYSFVYSNFDTLISTADSSHKVDVIFNKSNNQTRAYQFENYPTNKDYILPQVTNPVSDILAYARLLTPNIYPNIDLHYYSNQKGVKYYFVVKPGGDPNAIEHLFNGATSTSTNSAGDLIIGTTIKPLKLEKPYVYQISMFMSILPVSFQANWVQLAPNQYKFNVGSYNTSLPLIFEVDQANGNFPASPAADNLTWNTYVGGPRDDNYIDQEADSSGNIYNLLQTTSGGFYQAPTNLLIVPNTGVAASVVDKFDKYGVLKRRLYVAANTNLTPKAITILKDSSIVLVGSATGTMTTIKPATSYTNNTGTSFILKFNFNSSFTVLWHTFFPGSIADVDCNGNDDIYILSNALKTGTNTAFIFNKPNAVNLTASNISYFQASVLSRFTSAGVPVWSSYIPAFVGGGSIKVDKKRNNYYVTGQINDTTDFDHFNKYNTFYQPTKKSLRDGMIQKYTSNDTLIVSTLYGGNQDDALGQVVILNNGNIAMIGTTSSSDYANISFNPNDGSYFNVKGSYLSGFGNGSNGWLHKFDTVMNRKWSINYGDSTKSTYFQGLTKDENDNIFIGGISSGMQTVNNLIGSIYNQSTGSAGNAVFLMFGNDNQRLWATFMGGPTVSMAGPCVVQYNKANKNLFFCGGATAISAPSYPYRNFTAPQAYWQNFVQTNGWGDAFAGRFSVANVVGIKEITNSKKISSMLVFPNPCNETTNISVAKNLTKPYQLTVYNAIGQVVYQTTVKNYNNSYTLNTSNLLSGAYFINISSTEVFETNKFIKE